jgi:hypothetical protein
MRLIRVDGKSGVSSWMMRSIDGNGRCEEMRDIHGTLKSRTFVMCAR